MWAKIGHVGAVVAFAILIAIVCYITQTRRKRMSRIAPASQGETTLMSCTAPNSESLGHLISMSPERSLPGIVTESPRRVRSSAWDLRGGCWAFGGNPQNWTSVIPTQTWENDPPRTATP